MLELIKVVGNSQYEWSEYVRRKPEAHFYYDYRWRSVLEESLGYRSVYLMAREDGKVGGIFPLVHMEGSFFAKAMISMPFLNYGGILSNTETAASFLLEKAIELSKESGASYIEMRNFNRSSLPLITREHKVTMWLELPSDADAQWTALDAKVRNQIRKAQKSGLKIKHGKEELFDKFYEVFACNMRDLGTPVIGRIFFNKILEHFHEESNIFIVELNGKVIAGAFILIHGKTMEIPWASSSRDFNKLCPNDLLYWEAIKYAISQGLKCFDFGRCTKDSGTYRFKKQWGARAKQLYWQYWTHNESILPLSDPRKSRFAPMIAIWKRLPLFVANKIGPIIAKEIPNF